MIFPIKVFIREKAKKLCIFSLINMFLQTFTLTVLSDRCCGGWKIVKLVVAALRVSKLFTYFSSLSATFSSLPGLSDSKYQSISKNIER